MRFIINGLILAGLIVFGGCAEEVDVTPIDETLQPGLAGGSDVNLLCFPEDPQTLPPNTLTFQQVNALFKQDINGKTCASSSCHSLGPAGSGGQFRIYPEATEGFELEANFAAVKPFIDVDNPQNSKLLLEPLDARTAAVGSHGGGQIFTSEVDPNYQLIFNWIAAGPCE